jgi:hypothetical protein
MLEVFNFQTERANLEQRGGKFKFWCQDETDSLILFKEGRAGTGENWAEVVACELAKKLLLPTAHYALARWFDHEKEVYKDGVITRKFLADNHTLVAGNELLNITDPSYPMKQGRKVKQHTVRAAIAILKEVDVGKPLIETGHTMTNAIEVLAGYIIFDALISNTDRHHENWGVIVTGKDTFHLSPTYDHASSLGRNEPQESKVRRLVSNDKNQSVEHYVAKAKSAFYGTTNAKTLMTCREAALVALSIIPRSKYWIEGISKFTFENLNNIVKEVPTEIMTDIDKEFCIEMLLCNRNFLVSKL